jgi:hypothetical protein
VRRSAAIVVAILVSAGCGGADEPAGGTGGAQADGRVAEELGAEPVEGGPPLRLCDGRAVDVVKVHGAEAVETWRTLRAEAGASGLWPMLIGPPDDASVLAEMTQTNCEDGHTFKRTLERAARVDVARALARVARFYGVRPRDLRGFTPLPDHPPGNDFVVPLDVLSEQPLPEVRIALLPIDAGWKATAILPWGNCNDNPAPPVHTAVMRDWARRYGAEVVSMTGDVLELSVASADQRPGHARARPRAVQLCTGHRPAGRRRRRDACRAPQGRSRVVLLVGLSVRTTMPELSAVVSRSSKSAAGPSQWITASGPPAPTNSGRCWATRGP